VRSAKLREKIIRRNAVRSNNDGNILQF
jgi:hypothetical protein